jgi:hypothetical protein
MRSLLKAVSISSHETSSRVIVYQLPNPPKYPSVRPLFKFMKQLDVGSAKQCLGNITEQIPSPSPQINVNVTTGLQAGKLVPFLHKIQCLRNLKFRLTTCNFWFLLALKSSLCNVLILVKMTIFWVAAPCSLSEYSHFHTRRCDNLMLVPLWSSVFIIIGNIYQNSWAGVAQSV